MMLAADAPRRQDVAEQIAAVFRAVGMACPGMTAVRVVLIYEDESRFAYRFEKVGATDMADHQAVG